MAVATLASRFPSLRRTLQTVAVVEAVVVAGLAFWVAFRYRYFGIDEGAHISYVGWIDEHGSLPSLRDPSLWQVQAIYDGTYPRRGPKPTVVYGLGAENYEAFQPPLYYLSAVPAFAIPHGFLAKLRAVRVYDACLFSVAIGLLALLLRSVLPRSWLLPFVAGVSVLAWPGVITQAVTVSDAALVLPVTFLFLWLAVRAWRRPSAGRLLLTGGVLGLCLLTQLTLVALAPVLLAPAWRLWRADGTGDPPPGGRRGCRGCSPTARRRTGVALAVVLPLVMIAPWLAMNQSRYGDLTGQRVVVQQQGALIDPGHPHLGVRYLERGAGMLLRAFEAQQWWPLEWRPNMSGVIHEGPVIALLLCALLALGCALRSRAAAVELMLLVPLVSGALCLGAAALIEQWPLILPRYINEGFVLAGAFAPSRLRPPRARALGWVLVAAGLVVPTIGWLAAPGVYFR